MNWIKVTERLPENYKTVFVLLEDGSEKESWLFPDKTWGYNLKPIAWRQ